MSHANPLSTLYIARDYTAFYMSTLHFTLSILHSILLVTAFHMSTLHFTLSTLNITMQTLPSSLQSTLLVKAELYTSPHCCFVYTTLSNHYSVLSS